MRSTSGWRRLWRSVWRRGSCELPARSGVEWGEAGIELTLDWLYRFLVVTKGRPLLKVRSILRRTEEEGQSFPDPSLPDPPSPDSICSHPFPCPLQSLPHRSPPLPPHPNHRPTAHRPPLLPLPPPTLNLLLPPPPIRFPPLLLHQTRRHQLPRRPNQTHPPRRETYDVGE